MPNLPGVVHAAILLPAPEGFRRRKVRADRRARGRQPRPSVPGAPRGTRRFDAHVRICAHDPPRTTLCAPPDPPPLVGRPGEHCVRGSAARACAQALGDVAPRHPAYVRTSASKRGRPAGAQVVKVARRARRREVDERRRRRPGRVADADDRDGFIREPPRMKLCHESDGAARFANARATAASREELLDWGGGSMQIDGCATISAAATPQRVKSILIAS